jgi:prophage regulatory protein
MIHITTPAFAANNVISKEMTASSEATTRWLISPTLNPIHTFTQGYEYPLQPRIVAVIFLVCHQIARGFIAMHDRYVRAPELIRKAGLSLSTIWRLEKTGQFPQRRALGPNSVGWLESEVDHWLQSREPSSINYNNKER